MLSNLYDMFSRKLISADSTFQCTMEGYSVIFRDQPSPSGGSVGQEEVVYAQVTISSSIKIFNSTDIILHDAYCAQDNTSILITGSSLFLN